MTGLRNAAVNARAALTFLTRLPIGSCTCALPSGAAGYFPAVGTLLGLIGLLIWNLTVPLSAHVRAWLVTAAFLLLTGAFHEDGLADSADALGGAFSRERLFEILKDSRIGTFGAAALVAVLSLRATLYGELLRAHPWIIVLSQTVSRLIPVYMLYGLPYVTQANVSRSRGVTQVRLSSVCLATVWCAALIVLLVLTARVALGPSLIAVAAQIGVCGWLAFRFHRRAGGITGDFLGATQQCGELAFLLGYAWVPC